MGTKKIPEIITGPRQESPGRAADDFRVLTFPTASYDRLQEPVEAIFRALAPDLRGKRVLVKPNALLGTPPEKHVTTHPALVAAVVSSLTSRGAEIAVGDNPGVAGYGHNDAVFSGSGLRDASAGHYVNLSRSPVSVPLASRFTSSVVLSRQVRECDYLVNLPKLKTHNLTLYTGAMKNTFGYLCGSDKVRMHSLAPRADDFAELLVDLFALRPPDLTIMDAVVGMEGNGPNGGTPRPAGLLAASTSAVALDLVISRWIGLPPDRVPHLVCAQRRRLGPADPAQIRVEGPLPPIPPFRLPSRYQRQGPLVWLVRHLAFPSLLRTKLRVKPDLCTGCETCAKYCPVTAITLREKRPVFDHGRCVECFCCMELCREQAIVFPPGMLSLLTRRRNG